MGKYFFVLGMLVIMMSCGKDIDQFIPKTSQSVTGDISRLSDRLRSDIAGDITTTISCPCYGDRVFEIDKDLVLVIPPDFVDLSVYPCSGGFFTMDVVVCDTKGEILVAGIPTVAEDKLLESRIEFNLQIRDGTTPVRLAHGKQIRVLVNDPDPRDRMELFYGDDDNQEWIQVDQNPDTWDNVFNSEWWLQDSAQQIITGFGYECFSDSMDWINVDVFFEIPKEQLTNVCIELPEEFTNTNTAVFMVFDNYKSLLEMKGDPELKQFCEPYGATPIGFNVTFVVIAEMGEDNYFFTTKSTTITSNHFETLEPKRTPFAEIKNYINSL
jgi:hypothetical protein